MPANGRAQPKRRCPSETASSATRSSPIRSCGRYRVVDELMHVAVILQVLVGLQRIAMNGRSAFDVSENLAANILLACIGKHLNAGFSMPFQKAHNNGLAFVSTDAALAHSLTRLLVQMHVMDFPAHKGFIGLHSAGQFIGLLSLLCQPD